MSIIIHSDILLLFYRKKVVMPFHEAFTTVLYDAKPTLSFDVCIYSCNKIVNVSECCKNIITRMTSSIKGIPTT